MQQSFSVLPNHIHVWGQMSKYLLPDSPFKAKRELLVQEEVYLLWLSRVGSMSRRNGRGSDLCVSALFVCVLYCGTILVRPLNTSGHGGVWPGVYSVRGWWESGQGLLRQANPRQRPEDLRRHVLGRLLHSPTPSFLAPYPHSHHNTCYRIWVLLIHLGVFDFSPYFTNHWILLL